MSIRSRSLFAACGVVAGLFLCGPLLASPRIELSDTKIDVGEIQAGKDANCVFNFRNSGDEDLVITGIEIACDCAVVESDSKKVKPGESSKIQINFRAPTSGGMVSKHITVRTNDPDCKSTRLTLKGKVIPSVVLSPERVNFGALKTGATCEKSLIVTPVVQGDFKVEAARCYGKCVSVSEFTKTNDGTGSYLLKIVIKAGKSPGRILEVVGIKTNASAEEFSFLVFGNVTE